MTYTPTLWTNSPATTSPVNATNLNKLETGVDQAHDMIESHTHSGLVSKWKFSTNLTIEDPTDEYFRFNASNLSTPSVIVISRISNGGIQNGVLLDKINIGDQLVFMLADQVKSSTKWTRFTVTSVASSTYYYTFGVDGVDYGAGGLWTNNSIVQLEVFPSDITVSSHLTDTTDAHDASAISLLDNVPEIYGGAPNVQVGLDLVATFVAYLRAGSLTAELIEVIQDLVNSMIVAGDNVTKTYNDAAGTLTISATGGGGSFTGYNPVYALAYE